MKTNLTASDVRGHEHSILCLIEDASLDVLPVGRGWTVDRFDIAMTAPQWTRIVGYPRAFSPSITAPLSGTPILVDGGLTINGTVGHAHD